MSFAPEPLCYEAAATPRALFRQAATEQEWYLAGPEGQTLGPYSEDELRIALGKGNVTRTSLVWKLGLANWIPIHDIPGFDRRSA